MSAYYGNKRFGNRWRKAKFSIDWKVPWSSFSQITPAAPLSKSFITSFNNVPLRWAVELQVPQQGNGNRKKYGVFLIYQDGPVEKFMNMRYTIDIIRPDRSVAGSEMFSSYEAARTIGFGVDAFDDKNPNVLRARYRLTEANPMVLRFKLDIPIAAFPIDYPPAISNMAPPQWMIDLFGSIEDPQRSKFHNAKLISRNGAIFYCHKIIGHQSPVLETMFGSPPAAGRQQDEYAFPGLDTASLKALIQYLYTGQAAMGSLPTARVVDLFRASEQLNLRPLRDACIGELWKKVVAAPMSCFQVVQFSADKNDLKWLQDRAMDVLADHFEEFTLQAADLADRFGGGDRGARLRAEFLLFQSNRLEPN